jgi:hypothetical protein
MFENSIAESIWNYEGGINGWNKKIKKLVCNFSLCNTKCILIMFLGAAAVMVAYHIGSLCLLGI